MWTCIAVALFAIEIATTNLVTIWIAIGATVSAFAAMGNVGALWQWVIFIVLSAVLLIVTKPLLKKFVKNVPTNADMLIDQTAVVTEEIQPIEAKGQVKVGSAVWSAKSEDGKSIEKDELVRIIRIEGVKLVVKKESEE